MGRKFIVNDDTKIAVIGAGPAGSFFTISMLAECRVRNLKPGIVLFDSKDFKQKGPRGCNMCAGVLGRMITSRLEGLSFDLRSVIQRVIQGYHLHTPSGSIFLELTGDDTETLIYAVYRGAGPLGGDPARSIKSFDQFLLERAVNEGACIVEKRVNNVQMPENSGEKFVVRWEDGEGEFDLVVGAFGVNSNLMEHFRKLELGYAPPKLWRTCQAEIKMDPELITRFVLDKIHIFSLGLGNIKYITFTPKHHFLTVTAVGEDVKIKDLLQALKHPAVMKLIGNDYEVSCHCHPRLPASDAVKPFADRLVIIGDASYSRYLKNGIESAFLTASLAVKTILTEGYGNEAFRNVYFRECHKLFCIDNVYGKFMLNGVDIMWKFPFLDKVHIAVAKEEQLGGITPILTSILWDISTGEASYRNIFNRYHSYELYLRLNRHFWRILFTGGK